MSNLDQTEVEPGLRMYELRRAKLNVRETAGVRNRGFMLAYQTLSEPAPLGFNFLVIDHNFQAAIYAHAKSRAMPLEFFSSFHKGKDDEGAFMEEYFRTTSKNIGVSYVEFVNYLAGRESPWSFQGWIDGKPDDRWGDNSGAWSALWGRIVETAAPSKLPVDGESAEDKTIVIDLLLRHANKGQIVLDR